MDEEDDAIEQIIQAHARTFQRAFETAVRTGTALVFEKNGKIIEVKPPFRYELVPIKPEKIESKSKKKRESSPTT